MNGQTDMTKLIVGFSNFSSVPKNELTKIWKEWIVKHFGVPFQNFTTRNEENHENFRHGNACPKALFSVYCFIVCLLSHWCAYKGRNQNITKTAWRYTAVYLNFYFHMWVRSIATAVDTKHSNKHHYIYEWFISLHERMASSISNICFTKYRISVFDISYEKNVLTQRQYWTRGLSPWKSSIKNKYWH